MEGILNKKIYSFLFGIFSFSLLIGFVSCKDDDEPMKYVDLRYNPESSYLLPASSPEDITFEVKSNWPWEIIGTQDWYKITPSSGLQDSIYRITIKTQENTALDDRTDTLTIQSDYWVGTQVVITQKGTAWLKIDQDTSTVVQEGGQALFNVTSNQDWSCEVTEGNDWLSVESGETGSIDGSVRVVAEENKGEMRYGTVTVFDRHHVEAAKFVVAQAGVLLLIENPELRILYPEQDVTFTVSSNTKWKITKSEYDIWYTITTGESYEGNATVTLHLQENSGVSLRKSEITLTSISDDPNVTPAVKTIMLKQAAPPVIEHVEMNAGFLGEVTANGSPVFENSDMICNAGGQNRVNIWLDRLGTHSFRIKEMEVGSQPCWYMIDGWGNKEFRYFINTTNARTDISTRSEFFEGEIIGSNIPVDMSKPHTLSITTSDENGCMRYDCALDGVNFAYVVAKNIPSTTRLLIYLGSNGGSGRCVWDWYEYYPLINWDE